MRQPSFLVGLATGAGLTYLLDPLRGAQRRAELQGRTGRRLRELRRAANVLGRDLANRSRGTWSRAQSWRRAETVDDGLLEERVRAELGRLCSHPGAIEVSAMYGEIDLHGAALRGERDAILQGVGKVPGVQDVYDHLELHDRSEDVPRLQGGRPARRRGWRRRQWSPTLRFGAGAAGLALCGYGLIRRGWLGSLGTMVGAALLGRSWFNQEIARVLGLMPAEIAVRKALVIEAPPSEVFALWSRPENFPKFMSHVKRVIPSREPGRYHWVVSGPVATSFEWDAQVTQVVPERLIAWQSLPGSAVKTVGRVRLRPVEGGTEIDLRLSYSPPAGRLGHSLARLIGVDPKHQLDQDMLRLRSLLERGRTGNRKTAVTRQEVLSSPAAPSEPSAPRAA